MSDATFTEVQNPRSARVIAAAACVALIVAAVGAQVWRRATHPAPSPAIAPARATAALPAPPDFAREDETSTMLAEGPGEDSTPLVPRLVKSIRIDPEGGVIDAPEADRADARLARVREALSQQRPAAALAAVAPATIAPPPPVVAPIEPPARVVITTQPAIDTTPTGSTAVARTPSASPAAATPAPIRAATAAGSWSVQFAASPSEEEAQAVAGKLHARLGADLGERPLAIFAATVKDKAVFRVRVADLGKDEANALCSRLKSKSACFVARD